MLFFCDGSKILTDKAKSKTKKYPASIAKNISNLLANVVAKNFAKTYDTANDDMDCKIEICNVKREISTDLLCIGSLQIPLKVLKFIQNSVKSTKTKKEKYEKIYRSVFFGTVFSGFADRAKCRAANARKADSSQNDSSNDNSRFQRL